MKTFYLIIAFCLGIFTGYLLFNDSNTAQILVPPKPVVEIKAKQIDSNKLHSDSVLQKRNELLSGQLKIVATQLKVNKNSLLQERQKINELKNTIVHDSLPCTDHELIDSLTGRIDKLNAITDTMFSIYETKLKLNEDLVAVKDSELMSCNRSYRQMQDLVKEQSLREQQLTEDLNTVLKQQKKKKFQNRLIAAGMLFISGVATTLLIRSKQ